MFDVRPIGGTLDLWLCMWVPDERARFENALVRVMSPGHERRLRALALAAAHAIATPRLLAAAARLGEVGPFCPDEISEIEDAVAPLYRVLDAAERLRGNVRAVEHLIARIVARHARPGDGVLLDWVDVRDLVTVARTTVDARLFGEICRRFRRRGRYQRARAARVLGFRAPAAPSFTAAAGLPLDASRV
jgi:hypothetical protein